MPIIHFSCRIAKLLKLHDEDKVQKSLTALQSCLCRLAAHQTKMENLNTPGSQKPLGRICVFVCFSIAGVANLLKLSHQEVSKMNDFL